MLSFSSVPYMDVPHVILEIHEPLKRTEFVDQQAASSTAQALVLMLRLLGAGLVAIVSYHWKTPEQPFKWLGTPASFPLLPQRVLKALLPFLLLVSFP